MRVVIVGGGPAGMVAALLFARAGVETIVIEKHKDFLRDFRGDTVHPSTLALFAELGLDRGLLERPHDEVTELSARIAGRHWRVADFAHLPVPHRFVALMPQWEFLDFVRQAASTYPQFTLRMPCEAIGLTHDEAGRVSGVRLADGGAIAADLVIAADGRRSVIRAESGLTVTQVGAPMDVFWFRLPKGPQPVNETAGIMARGHILVTIDRHDYWQVAFVFAKGQADAIRARGLPAFRAEVAAIAPELGDGMESITDWDQVFLLTVALDLMETWHRPGLLVIGDAAHAMSPIGGVGINLAVQDAVAAANVLARAMAAGEAVDPLLPGVAARRLKPTKRMQALQRAIQNRIVEPALSGAEPTTAPWPVRLLDRCPRLRRIPARIVGLGFGRERLEL